MLDLQGVIPPLVTPFDSDGNIDAESIKRLVNHVTSSGVSALFPMGSTGEGSQLTLSQRQEVLAAINAANTANLPVLSGAIASSTQLVIEAGKQAAELGASAIIVTAPYYYTNSQAEILRHFRKVREAVDLPIIAYNIPSMVKVNLDLQTVKTLAEEQVIIGLKDTSSDLSATRAIVLACRHLDTFKILTGLEWIADLALVAGMHGLVPGIGNIAPRDYVDIYHAVLDGNLEKAQHHQERMIRLFDICYHGATTSSFSAGALGGFKVALQQLGIISTARMAPPMEAIPANNQSNIRAILQELDLIPVTS